MGKDRICYIKQKNNNFSSPVILSQTDTVTLPELLIKHAIDNSINNNNIYTDSPINNQHFGFPSPLQHPQPQLGYEMIPTTPQIPLQHNFGSPKEILDAANIELDKNYPKPIVDLKTSRQEALSAFAELKVSQ